MTVSDPIPDFGDMFRGQGRVKIFAERAQLDQFPCPIVTIAGTNGKGSCVRALEAIAMQAGYQVASFTSPHLMKINERICLNAVPVSDQCLDDALAFADALDSEPLSYFERIFMAALKVFHDAAPDLILLEVGLGGRLDATNALDADIAIITGIDLDHTHILGETRDAIALEKAGILRSGRPFICADPSPPDTLLGMMDTLAVDPYMLGEQFNFQQDEDGINWLLLNNLALRTQAPHLPVYSVAAGMVAAQILAKEFALPKLNACLDAATEVQLAGRFQCVQAFGRQVVLDVAHNPQSAKALAKALREKFPAMRWDACFGVVKDKHLSEIVFPLQDLIDRWYSVSTEGERGVPSSVCAQLLKAFMPNAEVLSLETVDMLPAKLAGQQPSKDQGLLVFGSFMVVGDILRFIEQ